MNRIVYTVTATGRHVKPRTAGEMAESVFQFMNRRRVSDGAHQLAKAALRAEYQRKADAVGLSLDAYCVRFNIKLYD